MKLTRDEKLALFLAWVIFPLLCFACQVYLIEPSGPRITIGF